MNRKKLFLVLSILVAILLIGTGWYLLMSTDLTDEAIRQKFDCDRVTADFLATDVYCNNPQLYRDHLKTNSVIQ